MEATSPPTDCRLSSLTDAWAPLLWKLVSAMAHTASLSPIHFRRLHPMFPVVKLSPALPDPIPGRQPAPPPPPTLIDGEEEYEVKAILYS
jgi:hypothetical protein